MIASNYSQMAYSNANLGIKSDRAIEYELIARITKRMREANAKLPYSFPDLAAALDENRRLWTIFAVDVAAKDNKLPSELRTMITELANFTLTHTQRVLAKDADIAPLVDINLAIMKGLSQHEVSA